MIMNDFRVFFYLEISRLSKISH